LFAILFPQQDSMDPSVGETLRDVKIECANVAGRTSFGITTDVRPGRGADLRDRLPVNDRFQSDDDLAIDPPLEVQAAQPAQLAGRAKIGSKRRVSLKVYGLADGSSEIGDSRRKMMRGMEQIDVNAHSEAASATSV
jgi:hypothetical protein